MDLVSKCKIFRLVSPFFPIKMAKWAQKFRHLKWVSFFELDETESNEPSVKMQHFWSLYNDNFYSTFGLSLNYPWFILGPLMEPPDGSGTFVPGEIRATDPGFSPLSSRRISLDGMTWRNFPSGFSPSPPPPPSTFHLPPYRPDCKYFLCLDRTVSPRLPLVEISNPSVWRPQ